MTRKTVNRDKLEAWLDEQGIVADVTLLFEKPPKAPRYAERNAEAARLYTEERLTLQEIGDRFGVTRESVRLWLKAANVPKVAVRSRTTERRNLRIAALVERRDEMRAMYFECGNTPAFAKRLGVGPAIAKGVVDAVIGRDEWRLAKVCGAHRVSDDLLSGYLRDAAAQVGQDVPLTYKAYDEIAEARGWPTHQTFELRWGGWRDACSANGVRCNDVRRSYTRKWPAEKCWECVRGLAVEIGRVPTVTEYELWSKGHPDRASVAIVRRRIGGWKDVIRTLSTEL